MSSYIDLLMFYGLACLSFLRISFSWIPIVIDVFSDRLLSFSKLPEYRRRIRFRPYHIDFVFEKQCKNESDLVTRRSFSSIVDAATRRDGIAGSHHAGRRQTRSSSTSGHAHPRILGRASQQVPMAAAAFASSAGPRWMDIRGLPVPEATPRPFPSAPRCKAEVRTRRTRRPPRYPYRPGRGMETPGCDGIIPVASWPLLAYSLLVLVGFGPHQVIRRCRFFASGGGLV
jgi:hypothetical protein